MNPPTPAFIEHPPRDVATWVARFDVERLCVLQGTAVEIEDWRAVEDTVDARLLSETLGTDPLMTLKLLAHVARGRSPLPWGADSRSDAETVTEALVLLGIGPFFRAFAVQPTVEQALADRPDALAGFHAVLRRAHRAANFAIGFAAHRADPDAAVIHEAALLHDFAELLLWSHAPALALAVAQRQEDDPTLRSAQVQREVLNIELTELQRALMTAWRLPALLVRITDDRYVANAQVQNVLLAVRLARHSAKGWSHAAIADDVRDIARLLQLDVEPTLRLLRDIDGADAH